jgi:hypothetical protein
MLRRVVLGSVAAFALLAGSGRAEVVLYDGALDTTPDLQGWTYLTLPLVGADASQSASGGRTTLDTTADMSEMAGYFLGGPFGDPALAPVLDRATGYTLSFDLRLDVESHASGDRAGFSLIALGGDLLGIELGFWADEVWAQDDDPLFTHDEGAAFDTTAALVRYELRVLGASYTLAADGVPILSGALRDYAAFDGSPDPYEVPNLLFFGDDTSGASARAEIARIGVTTGVVPEPSSLAILAVGLGVLALRRAARPRKAA